MIPGGDGMDKMARAMEANASLKRAVWGLGSHYPGSSGTSDFLRGTKLPMWAAEDYSTYSDATGKCAHPQRKSSDASFRWRLLGKAPCPERR